jgi:hypothetical protein
MDRLEKILRKELPEADIKLAQRLQKRNASSKKSKEVNEQLLHGFWNIVQSYGYINRCIDTAFSFYSSMLADMRCEAEIDGFVTLSPKNSIGMTVKGKKDTETLYGTFPMRFESFFFYDRHPDEAAHYGGYKAFVETMEEVGLDVPKAMNMFKRYVRLMIKDGKEKLPSRSKREIALEESDREVQRRRAEAGTYIMPATHASFRY